MTRALLRDNNNPTIIPVPRRWASRPDCRCLPIQIVALHRCCLPAFAGRGGKDTAHNHARVHVPRLRLKAEFDGDAVLARLTEKVVKFAERLDRKRAGRFQEHLEDARPVAPDKRISAPCILHTIFPPSPGSYAATVRWRRAAELRKSPGYPISNRGRSNSCVNARPG